MSPHPHPVSLEELLAEEEFVRALARGILAEDPDELVQQTYLRALESRSAAIRHPRTWLARVASRLASNWRRSARRRSTRERAAAQHELVPSSAELMEREERRRSPVRAVDRLPAELRAIVLLRYFEGLPPRRIAKQLDLPADEISRRLHRAHGLLRRALEAEHGDARSALMPWLPCLPLEPSRVLLMSVQAKSALAGLLVAALLLIAFVGLGPWSADLATKPAELVASDVERSRSELAGDAASAVARTNAPIQAGTPRVENSSEAALPRLGSLLVRIRWSDGTPAIGVFGYVARAAERQPEHDLGAPSSSDGTIRFERLEPGRVRVALLHGGGERELEIEAGREAELNLEIPAGFSLHGRVVDEHARPVSHARIWVSRAETMWGEIAATTDEHGTFALRDLSGMRFIVALAEGYQPSALHFVEGAAGARREIEIALSARGGAIEGSVANARGEPLAGAVVHVLHRLAPPPARSLADADGRFRCTSVPPGEVLVSARADGFAPALVPVQVVAGQSSETTVTLVRGATIGGSIRDETGNAIAGALVKCTCEAQRSYLEALTEQSGAFRFGELPPGEHEIEVSAAGFDEARETLALLDEQNARREFVLRSGIAVLGRLLDAAELTPLAGWRVQAMPLPVLQDGYRAFGHPAREAITEKDGRFRIAGLPAAPCCWLVYEPRRSELPCYAMDGVTAAGGELIVRVPASARSTSSICGELRDASGVPLGSRTVRLRSQIDLGLGVRTAQSDEANGRFELGPMPPGRYELSIEWERGLQQRLEEIALAPQTQEDLGVLTLPASGRLEIAVRAAHDAPLERVTRRILDARGSRVLAVMTERCALVPGDYVALAAAAGMATARQAFRIRAGETSRVELELHAGLAIELAFALPAGDSARTLELRLRDDRGSEVAYERLECSGDGFGWRGSLVPGEYRVEARTDSGLSVREPFALGGNSATRTWSWRLR